MNTAVIENLIVEEEDLGMHPKLLLDVISRQAGSIGKAILEGIMNACEAGATKVKIGFKEGKITKEGRPKATLTIFDDGQGISSIEDINRYFDTFGTPHEESENKTWAQFRMGRGQMFSFGKNIWRTSTYKLTVDIKERGLKRILERPLPNVKGCQITIELYHNPIGDWDNRSIDALKANIQKQIMFMETPILFNGEKLNTPASECKWDFEDEDAYYLFNVGSGVRIYNLGAYSKEEPAYRVGCTGVVVSKKRLEINFARNDIMADCSIYQAIQEVLKENRIKKTRKAKTRLFTEAERIATLTDLRDGEQEYSNVKNIKLLPTANYRLISLEDVRKEKGAWTFAEDGDRVADRAMQYNQTLCLSDRLPGLLDYTGKEKEFFNWLLKCELKNASNVVHKSWQMVENFYIPAIKIREGYSEIYQIIPDKKQTRVEKRILKVLNDLCCWEMRAIRLGKSDTADAWTDGSTYIIINKKLFCRNEGRGLHLNYFEHVSYLFSILCHELAHDIDTAGTHVHGSQFFERYHEITMSKETSPMRYAGDILRKMKSAVIKEREDEKIRKQEKVENKINKKLGIAAKVSVGD